MPLIAPILNFLIDTLDLIVWALLFLLPETPFQFAPMQWGAFGSAVTLFVPVSQMAVSLALILTACLTYYAIRWLMRLIKQIQ